MVAEWRRKMKIGFHTLGCKVNQYETEAIAKLFTDKGWSIGDFKEVCDAYLINTCTVTSLSDRKSRQMIRRAQQTNPDAVVAVCGCYAQMAKDEVAAIEGVDIVIGTKQKGRAYELITQSLKDHKKFNIVSELEGEVFEDMQVTTYENKTRAIIKAQDGCNNFCAYCVIPYARGRVRSRDPESIYRECCILAEKGFREIVLSGIHICSYGKDFEGFGLGELLKKIHDIEGIRRIRLSSIEPNAFTDPFIQIIRSLPKVCHHFHMSLQSGCDATLKRMNRKYTAEEYQQIVEKLRDTFPDVSITTDIIVGFPGETEEQFAETMAFARAIGFYRIHVFKYSVRKGTAAEKMAGQISPEKKEQRSKALIHLAEKSKEAFEKSYIGKTQEVLFEQPHNGYFSGLTPNYLQVYVKTEENLEGQIHNVQIENLEDGKLQGRILKR